MAVEINVPHVSRSLEYRLPPTSLLEMTRHRRSAAGVEIETREIPPITFRDLMEGEVWQRGTRECVLPLALGTDAADNALVRDLVEAPHLLVAGCVGSGKTTFLNVIVNCFLMSQTPEQVRLILVDTRREAFHAYRGVPHLILPVVNKLSDVLICLRWASAEADRRRLNPGEHRPRIVIVVDEFSEIMLEIGKDVEAAFQNVLSCARDVGIHLILATQRFWPDVLTDEIKANIPCRIAFKTEFPVYSKVILDAPGAEELSGNGSMLIRWQPYSPLIRAQGAWINTSKIVIIAAHWRRQGPRGKAPAMDAAATKREARRT